MTFATTSTAAATTSGIASKRIVIEPDEGPATIGGNQPGFNAFFEDFAARELTLRAA